MPQSPFKITKHGLVGNLTGSVEGTASCALTASYVSGAVMSETVKGIEKMTSASYAEITPDPDKVYIITDKSASVETASYSVHADSASNAVSSSYALTASFCENAGSDLPLETGSAPYSIQSMTGSVASGTASFARGFKVTASGDYSHAEGFGTRALGQASHAEGSYTTSSGPASHAEGLSTKASGNYSHAEGSNTKASGYCSHVEGSYTIASGSHSHAEGTYTTSSGQASHAEGQATVASNNYEHAQGQYNATASSQIFSIGCGDNNARRKNAISVITGSKTVSSASVYIYGVGTYNGTNPQPGTNDLATVVGSLTGSVTSASYDSTDKEIQFFNGAGTKVAFVDATDFIKDGMIASASISESYLVLTFNTDAGQEPISMSLLDIFNPANYYTKADIDAKTGSWDAMANDPIWVRGEGLGSTVLSGSSAQAVGEFAVAEGNNTVASESYSHAEGYSTLASAWYAHAEGSSTNASGDNSHAEGEETVASGVGSHAEGITTNASGSYSHAEGESAIASGYASHAEGNSTVASGEDSHAEGDYTEASGNYSHAEGHSTSASNDYSHAEGQETVAFGYASHAEGESTIASGNFSHAEGYSTKAEGDYSHTEGNNTNASGNWSHAEGSFASASGIYSHAEGQYTIASGEASHAEGEGTQTSNKHEHAQGSYNVTASGQIFSVGCGEYGARKNAISIITGSLPLSASIFMYGVAGYDGTNPQPGTNDIATTFAAIVNMIPKAITLTASPTTSSTVASLSGSGLTAAEVEAAYNGFRTVVKDTQRGESYPIWVSSYTDTNNWSIHYGTHKIKTVVATEGIDTYHEVDIDVTNGTASVAVKKES